MTSTELAVRSAVSELAITDEQTRFNEMQLAGLKQLGIEDAPQAVLDLFFHRCRTTRLDPFSKQIYLIPRKTRINDFSEKVPKFETKYTTQTGIDGYRLNGKRAARREGSKLAFEGPYWHDGTGWSDVWLGGNRPPVAAKYIIYVDGVPHPGIAMYAEYVQTTGYGNNTKPNSMWSKMPANQTAKCAEAQAWRKAFPDDFSDLHLEDAAHVIDPDGSPVAPVRAQAERVSAAAILAGAPRAGTDGSASNSGAKPEDSQTEPPVQDDEPVAAPAAKKAPAKPKVQPGGVTPQALEEISGLLDELQVPQDNKRRFIEEFFKRPIADVRELTPGEGKDLIGELRAMVAAPPADGAQQPIDGAEGGES